jgi:hypothetical protein
LKNANDWNLSRSRYWGIPLPIWRTEDGTEEMLIGSVEELYSEIEKSIAAGFQKENPFKGFQVGNMSEANYELVDLHKNVVDNIVLVSPSGNANAGYTVVLTDQRAGTITVTRGATNVGSVPVFLGEEITTTAQVVSGLEFRFTPNPNLTIDVSTTLTVYGNETGGSQTIPVTVTYKA